MIRFDVPRSTPGRSTVAHTSMRATHQEVSQPLAYFWTEWKPVAFSAFIASAAAVAEATGLVLVATVAEHIGSPNEFTIDLGPASFSFTFAEAAWTAGALVVASALGRLIASYISIRRRTYLMNQWRSELTAGFLGSTYAHQSSRKRGEVLEIAGQQSGAAAQVIEILANALNSVLSMLVLVVGAFALDPVVALILLVGGGGLLLALRPASKRARRLSAKAAGIDIELGNQLDEMLRMSKDIKVFGSERAFTQRATNLIRRSAEALKRMLLINRVVPIAFQTTGLLLLLVALGVSASIGPTSITVIGGTALLLLRGITYGQQLSTFQQTIARSTPFVGNVLSQLDEYAANRAESGSGPISAVESIELQGVGYDYVPGELPALDDVNLVLKDQGIVGLVGPSGSGKSTLAQLILRVREPTRGRILVNGAPANMLDIDQWRQLVSFVPQEAELIHGTVRENVGFFREWITDDDIVEALEAVGLTELVDSLPAGLDTSVGPTVRQLSGGQKQRIGIARALVGKPALFVLDEPTSALDDDSEAWVMASIQRLRSSCIVIVITHRASTREHCDTVINLSKGRVSAIESQRGSDD